MWPLLSLAVCAATASGAASGASQTSQERVAGGWCPLAEGKPAVPPSPVWLMATPIFSSFFSSYIRLRGSLPHHDKGWKDRWLHVADTFKGLAIAFLFLKYPFEEVVAAVDRPFDLLHGRHWAEDAGTFSYFLLLPKCFWRCNYHHLTNGNTEAQSTKTTSPGQSRAAGCAFRSVLQNPDPEAAFSARG